MGMNEGFRASQHGGWKGFAGHVLPLLLYCTLLFFVSGMPQPPTPDLGIDWGDKILHGGAFFFMALLAYRGTSWLFPERKRAVRIVMAVGFASLYGATDEVHQYFVPQRSSDILDWIADTTGALLAVPVVLWLTRKGAKQAKAQGRG